MVKIYDNFDSFNFNTGKYVVYSIVNKLLGIDFVHFIELEYFNPTFIPDYFEYDRQKQLSLEFIFDGHIIACVNTLEEAENIKVKNIGKRDGSFNYVRERTEDSLELLNERFRKYCFGVQKDIESGKIPYEITSWHPHT